VKKLLKRFGKWLWRHIVNFYLFLEKIIRRTPQKIENWIYAVANWGKRQLDKRINIAQKEQLHTIIFKSETPEGRRFDTIITWIILASIIAVMFETVTEFHRTYWWILHVAEWIFTLIFTTEYILRLYCARNPIRYATSFFGIVDLLAIIPSYLGIFFLGFENLMMVRALRLLRVFRIFKMGHFVSEGEIIVNALKASRTKIYVFVSFVVLMSMIIGSVLYIVEGAVNPNLNNIPKGIYWAIVTLTTVGYGDVTPITTFGKFLSTIVMIMGYGVIAVPTGIVTAEISGRVMNMKEVISRNCDNCGQSEHHKESIFCHKCGENLENI
jgi:voltage-gated potassium channel